MRSAAPPSTAQETLPTLGPRRVVTGGIAPRQARHVTDNRHAGAMPATQPPPITSLPLPTALGMFQVTGSFGTTDPDTGDWIPATGTVVAFDPTIDSIKVLGDDPMG